MEEIIKEDEIVSVGKLAELTGFPIEMIKEELLKDSDKNEVSLAELRKMMANFIDSTMLEN